MSGCLLNIVLDPLFILPQGLNMGAAGAALATFLSNCVACLYFFVFLFLKRGIPMCASIQRCFDRSGQWYWAYAAWEYPLRFRIS